MPLRRIDYTVDKRRLACPHRIFLLQSSISNVISSENTTPQGIFGVPLQTSIRYANVAISLYNDDGKSYIYGYVPIVVAKCGVFLKEKGELINLTHPEAIH